LAENFSGGEGQRKKDQKLAKKYRKQHYLPLPGESQRKKRPKNSKKAEK